jgi:hypothetical protein
MKLGAGFSLAGTQVLGAEDKRVTLDVGDEIFVKLSGAEGPGYGWTLIPGDRSVIDSTDGETFVAKGPGATRLVFAYHHPFENQTPIKTVTIEVQVKPSNWLTRHWWGVAAGSIVAGGIASFVATRRKRRRKL